MHLIIRSLLLLVCAVSTIDAVAGEPLKAQYRGCESAGWCRFWIESLDPLEQSHYRVIPNGVPRSPGDEAVSIAVRDRLNALLANMVHQYKRIFLHDLRETEDGLFAATVIVNEAQLASDPILLELGMKLKQRK